MGYLLLREHPWALLPTLLTICSALLLWTLFYHRLFRTPACCTPLVLRVRTAGFGIAVWACVACMLQLASEGGSNASNVEVGSGASDPVSWQNRPLFPSAGDAGLRINELVCLVGMGVVPLLVALYCVCERCIAARATREERSKLYTVFSALKEIETYWLTSGDVFVSSWPHGHRLRWQARTRAPDLRRVCESILTLEQHIRPGVQTTTFMRERHCWRQNVVDASSIELADYLMRQLQESVPVTGKPLTTSRTAADDALDASDFLAQYRMTSTGQTRSLDRPRLRLQYHDLFSQLHVLCTLPSPSRSADRMAGAHSTTPSVVVGEVLNSSAPASAQAEVPTSAAPAPTSATEPPPRTALAAGAAMPMAAPLGGATCSQIEIAVGYIGNAGANEGTAKPAPPTTPFARQLLMSLDECSTNFEKEEAVIAAIRGARTATEALSCAELALVSSSFTFSSRRRAAMVALYPLLTDKAGFLDLLDGPHGFSLKSDRQDVLRELKLV